MNMNKKLQYLQAMEIDVWQSKTKTCTPKKACAESLHSCNWQELEQEVNNCTLCELHKIRIKPVFGAGSKQAKIMFIGEAPGANEDAQGEPFVGRAGMLLTAMIQSIGLKRENIYITNILKCHPPENRDPEAAEINFCTPFLQQQIALVDPKILIAVGFVAAKFLLNTKESMGDLRGNIYTYGEKKIPLLVIYHPAYLIRSPSKKHTAYMDFLIIKKLLE